jgi:N-acetylneuraminic acid mutarotase
MREAHTATFINDKLYILGGAIPPLSNRVPPKENFLYLDFSAPFNTTELKWHDLSIDNIVPPHYFAATVKGGLNNSTLFLYGGENITIETKALVYTFDTQVNKWSIPEMTGKLPTGKLGITPIIDHYGLIYFFGGYTTQVGPTVYVNDMFILDSINLSWKQVSSINALSPRTGYGAVLLPSNNILFMGM